MSVLADCSRLECTEGAVSDCGSGDHGDGDSVFACTPRLLQVDGKDVPDDEYSFVYAQPGQGS